jgi:hypothetical protein
MDKYIIIKELLDASVGTEVIWDECVNAFYYEKACWNIKLRLFFSHKILSV